MKLSLIISEEQKLVRHGLELTPQSLSFELKMNNIFCKFNVLFDLILINIKSLKKKKNKNNLNGLKSSIEFERNQSLAVN
jgi:hypothetical protein